MPDCAYTWQVAEEAQKGYPMEGLTPGRIVHFVMPDGRYPGEHRPAIIVKVWTGQPPYTVQLQVFTDGLNDAPTNDHSYAKGIAWFTSVTYDETGKQLRSWHWIERA